MSPSRRSDTSTSTFESPDTVDVFVDETLPDTPRPGWTARVACPLRWTPAATPPVSDRYGLWLDRQGLALLVPGGSEPLRLAVPDLAARSGGRDLLLRACTPGRRHGLRVLDACAGFGLDGLVIAQRHAVTMVDRIPLVHVLQIEMAARAHADVEHRLGEAVQHLRAGGWDVIYLDPMFPQRNKAALPKLAMQHMRALAEGTPPDRLEELLEEARDSTAERVVLKRRARDPTLATPSFVLRGKAVRFDVYQADSRLS